MRRVAQMATPVAMCTHIPRAIGVRVGLFADYISGRRIFLERLRVNRAWLSAESVRPGCASPDCPRGMSAPLMTFADR